VEFIYLSCSLHGCTNIGSVL